MFVKQSLCYFCQYQNSYQKSIITMIFFTLIATVVYLPITFSIDEQHFSNDDDNALAERGSYIGCFMEKIDLYKTPIFAGNVESCLEMCESSYFRFGVLSNDRCACANELDGQRVAEVICNTRCSRNKSQFCGGVDSQSYYDTGVKASGPPKNFRIINQTETSLMILWEDTQQPKLLTGFSVEAKVINTFSSHPLIMKREWNFEKQIRHAELVNLHPGTQYNVTITSLCGPEKCGNAFSAAETLIGIPDPAPEEPKILQQSEMMLTIDVNPGVNNNGPLSYYRLIVMLIDRAVYQAFDEELLTDYKQSQEDGLPYYITAEVDNSTRLFTVGNGKTYRGYFNAPLPLNSHVHVSIGIVSVHNGITRVKYSMAGHSQHDDIGLIFDSEDYVDDTSSLNALITACSIFGCLLIASIFAYFYLRYKTSQRQRPQRFADTHELTVQRPVVEVENNGYVHDDLVKGNFQTKLNTIVENLPQSLRHPRNAIRLNLDDIIAQGNFGDVISGKLYTKTDSHDCQVHIVSEDMEKQDQGIFLKELEELSNIFPHDKFLRFFGVSASPDWFYVIFERPPTVLKKILVEARVPPSIDGQRFSALSEEQVLQWLFDIACGMEYLEGEKIYHKKLCTYNVYVTRMNQLKISLFGPTPFVDHDKTVDISRWLAPEVLRFQQYSTKSDVWSYACVAWEVCTLGATLYANITSQDLLPRIKNGLRPEQPSFIFEDIFQLLLNCWQLEPNERPDFEEIAFNVRQILTSPRHALAFDRRENLLLPYYLPLLEVKN